MLTAAQQARGQGVDVVVGLVETHGRAETQRLTEGLDHLPRREIEHRGRRLTEFDLDAALVRKPAVLLVDELAHTNAPDSRHPKRWQDVQELLAAGIDVWTTVNVQHLETLNDIVGGITGVRVHETLPDLVFDSADEIVLVDLPPDELLVRLKEGKVYIPEQAERAAKNFFRKGNLLALRELALRRTADRVDRDMRSYRRDYVGGNVWRAQPAILVAVGPNPGEDTVVRNAARLAGALDARWHAIYVETPSLARLSDERRAEVVRVLRLAATLGAQTATVSSPDVAAALVAYAREHNLASVVLGRPTIPSRWRVPWRRNAATEIAQRAPDVDVIQVARDARPREIAASETGDRAKLDLRGYAVAAGMSAVTTLVTTLLLPYFDLANIAMVFLLAVVAAAMLAARAGDLRGHRQRAGVRLLLRAAAPFVRGLGRAVRRDLRGDADRRIGHRTIDGKPALSSPRRPPSGIARPAAYRARTRPVSRTDRGAGRGDQRPHDRGGAECESHRAARRSRRRAASGGRKRERPDDRPCDRALGFRSQCARRPGNRYSARRRDLYLPLKAPMRVRGVLAVEPNDPAAFQVPEQRQLLDTLAALVAIALERVHFVTVAQSTLVQMESERLRNSLLAALSHDLRTPLTALVGLADTLSMEIAQNRGTPAETAASIRDQARRTALLVDNLLEMARLQAGGVTLRRDWQSLEELAGSAVASVESALAGHPLDLTIPPDLPLLHCDGVLIERVLVNLLENAAKYTPAGTRIGLTATAGEEMIEITVWDEGPGLPAGDTAALFDKFTRGDKESRVPGVGLGLAICRAIVEAHGGTIAAFNRTGGGARITFTLPRATAPQVEAETVTS